ncbi:transposase (plasmid) [Shinella sumterensis]|nr:transposase [Shinella sumterensis]
MERRHLRALPLCKQAGRYCHVAGGRPILHSIRAHLAELGISIGVGISQMVRVVRELAEGKRSDLPELARFVLEALAKLVCDLAQRLQAIEKKPISWHYRNDLSNRLETIAGVGFVTASALSSIVPDPQVFKSGRPFAAWLSLVPRQNSSGGKARLGRISKQGNRYIRQLLILGATSVLRYIRRDGGSGTGWAACFAADRQRSQPLLLPTR